MNQTFTLSGDPSVLRRLNLRAVLRVLHAGGVHTITELSQQTQLSRPTTKQAVDDLVTSGWVGHAAPRESASIGRPAQAFEFRPDAGYVLGADLGGHKVVVLIAGLDGEQVVTVRRDLDPDLTPDGRLEQLGHAIDAALLLFGRDPGLIVEATIATVGTVDHDGVVIWNIAMPGWVGRNPSAWVAERYPFPVTGTTDMSMAALAEHWRGAAQDVGDVLFVHMGRRIGAAALIGGRPHNGHHGAATQFGLWKQIPWRADYGPLLQLGDEPEPDGAKALFDAATAGDTAAAERITTLVNEMVDGIMPMLITIDPELVVIGGGVSRAGEAIAAPVRARIEEGTPFAPRVVTSTLGDEAVAIGALRLSLDRAEDRLFEEIAPPPATRG